MVRRCQTGPCRRCQHPSRTNRSGIRQQPSGAETSRIDPVPANETHKRTWPQRCHRASRRVKVPRGIGGSGRDIDAPARIVGTARESHVVSPIITRAVGSPFPRRLGESRSTPRGRPRSFTRTEWPTLHDASSSIVGDLRTFGGKNTLQPWRNDSRVNAYAPLGRVRASVASPPASTRRLRGTRPEVQSCTRARFKHGHGAERSSVDAAAVSVSCPPPHSRCA